MAGKRSRHITPGQGCPNHAEGWLESLVQSRTAGELHELTGCCPPARVLVEVGEAPAALCLRTDDIETAAQRTGRTPLSMSRIRFDGVELAWHLVALDAALTDGLPFFIQWHVDDVDHPGRGLVEHRRAAVGIDLAEVGGDQDRLTLWLGDHELPLRHVGGPPGPHRLAVTIADGEPVVIG